MAAMTFYFGIAKRLQYGLFGGFFAACSVGGGAYLYLLPELAWHGPGTGPAYGVAASLILVCAGFLGVYFLRVLFDWRPQLRIADEGLTIPKYSGEPVRWADIASVNYSLVTSSRNSNYSVILQVAVLDQEYRYLSRGDRPGEGAEVRYTVDIAGLTLDHKKILPMIYDRLPAGARHSDVPTYP